MSPEVIFEQTALIIEVESGTKGMEYAELQLMLNLKLTAIGIGHRRPIYGAVIAKHFDKARLVKYQSHSWFQDGYFHPSILGRVAQACASGSVETYGLLVHVCADHCELTMPLGTCAAASADHEGEDKDGEDSEDGAVPMNATPTARTGGDNIVDEAGSAEQPPDILERGHAGDA